MSVVYNPSLALLLLATQSHLPETGGHIHGLNKICIPRKGSRRATVAGRKCTEVGQRLQRHPEVS